MAVLTLDFVKQKWPNISRGSVTPNYQRLWKLHTGLQRHWTLYLSTLPLVFRTYLKRELWTNEQKSH